MASSPCGTPEAMKRLLLIALVGCGSSQPAAQAPAPAATPEPVAAAAAPAPDPVPAVPAGHPKDDLISRAVLFGNPEKAGAQISPDGKQLAWLAPKDGVLNVWVAPIGKLDQAKPVTSDTARPIRQYFWAYTNKHIVFLQDIGGDENFHAFRVDLADGKTVDLTPYKGARAVVIETSPAQPTTLAVLINDRDPKASDLYKVDLISAKRTLVAQNDDGFAGYRVDDNLVLRLAEKKLPDGATQLLAPETKAGKTTWTVFDTIPFEDADTSGVLAFGPGGKAAYMRESRGRDTAALVSIDLKTRKQTVLADDAHADAANLIVHPTRHTVQAVAFNYLRTSWKVLDSSIQKDLDALAKLDGGEVRIGARTLDDKTWTVVTTSEQHPVRFYLWDRTRQKATFLFAAQPELEKQPLVKMTPVEIKARDGLTLVSYLSLPAASDPDGDGVPNAPVPMVLFVHGGPWARDNWGYSPIHQLLANRGYAVLAVNYRGSTGFGKKFLNAANLQWGKAMHTDLLDAVAWAVQQGVTAKDTVCIMGGSYGGYATLVGLSMTPDVFRCGVDIVGPSNLMTLLATIPPYWRNGVAQTFHSRMGNPDTAEGKAILEAASPLTHVASIKRPLLIGQGANDPRVKQAESEQIVAAMKARHLPVTYIVFPDEGHGFARPVNNIAFYGAAEAFLSAHLGGTYLPLTKAEVEASSMQVKEGKAGVAGL
jgi:dipeptidyl aminopeptidase/acylaminoacyl peptidase